jgi:hypothetical protein
MEIIIWVILIAIIVYYSSKPKNDEDEIIKSLPKNNDGNAKQSTSALKEYSSKNLPKSNGNAKSSHKGLNSYTISFFDANLDLVGSITRPSGIVDIAKIADELGIEFFLYYRANAAFPMNCLQTENIKIERDLTEDINCYACENVHEIRTQKDLDEIRYEHPLDHYCYYEEKIYGNYILMNDIELDETKEGFEAGKGWKPIGDKDNKDYGGRDDRFKGIFNGNNHKITSLWINRPNTDNVGLFGCVEKAQIKNLGVEISGKEVKGHYNVGGIVGSIEGGSITNSYSIGNVSGNGGVGGIVGCGVLQLEWAKDKSGHDYVTGKVKAGSTIMKNSYCLGNISGKYDVGGIIGHLGYITDSYFKGDVNGDYNVGGIAGSGSVVNSHSTGNISGENNVGGIVGCCNFDFIKSSYSTGNISGKKNVGGIAGTVSYGCFVINSYFNGDIRGGNNVGGIAGCVEGEHEDSYDDENGDYQNNGTYRRGLIMRSCVTGNIKGYNYVGGIAGICKGHIENSYSTGDISGNSDNVGGIAGGVGNWNKKFESDERARFVHEWDRVDYWDYSYIKNSVAINKSLAHKSKHAYIDTGCITGYICRHISGSGSPDIDDYKDRTISNNFALDSMEINGAVYDSEINEHSGISKTKAELKTKSTYETGLKWKFGNDSSNPWKIDPKKNNGYPYLYWQDL